MAAQHYQQLAFWVALVALVNLVEQIIGEYPVPTAAVRVPHRLKEAQAQVQVVVVLRQSMGLLVVRVEMEFQAAVVGTLPVLVLEQIQVALVVTD